MSTETSHSSDASAIKDIVATQTGSHPLSVQRGRGTAHRWVTIKMPRGIKLSSTQLETVERMLVARQLVGQYYSDSGIDDDWRPCITWEWDT